MLEPGYTITDDLVLTRRLGSGAFAEVWSAGSGAGEESVAVKVLQRCYAAHVARFERETRVWKRLDSNHPNIVGWLDSGELPGRFGSVRPYIVMDLMDGGALDKLLGEIGKFTVPEAVEVAMQVLRGLDHAHSRGVVHRDVKPGNVLIGSEAAISDFGLALLMDATRLTRSNQQLGTLQYSPPEQLDGHATPASDLYAVGTMLYHMLTGKLPFTGRDAELVGAIYQLPAPDLRDAAPMVPDTLADLVASALAKEPSKRPKSAAGFADALAEAAS